MTRHDFALGTLSVTAVILFVALVLIHMLAPQPVMAFGQSAHAGRYVASTTQYDERTELLFLLDSELQVMNCYGFNVQAGAIELIQVINVRSNFKKRR